MVCIVFCLSVYGVFLYRFGGIVSCWLIDQGNLDWEIAIDIEILIAKYLQYKLHGDI